MHAVHHRHHTVAQLLTDNNANVTLRAKNGSSAFDIANMIGNEWIDERTNGWMNGWMIKLTNKWMNGC